MRGLMIAAMALAVSAAWGAPVASAAWAAPQGMAHGANADIQLVAAAKGASMHAGRAAGARAGHGPGAGRGAHGKMR